MIVIVESHYSAPFLISEDAPAVLVDHPAIPEALQNYSLCIFDWAVIDNGLFNSTSYILVCFKEQLIDHALLRMH